jgi:hypothetical protein
LNVLEDSGIGPDEIARLRQMLDRQMPDGAETK